MNKNKFWFWTFLILWLISFVLANLYGGFFYGLAGLAMAFVFFWGYLVGGEENGHS